MNKQLKQALIKFIAAVLSYIVSYLIIHFVFRSDNMWFMILIASVLMTLVTTFCIKND